MFERIKNSPQYADRNNPARTARLPKLGMAEKLFLGIFFTMFCGIALFIFVMAVSMSGAVGMMRHNSGFALIPLCMSFVPLGMFVLGIVFAISQFKKMNQMENAPLETVPAIVVGKRTEVTGGGKNSSARTTYHATFETEDGRREEYQLWDGRLYGRLSDDDGGVVFLRDRYAVDFDRVV